MTLTFKFRTGSSSPTSFISVCLTAATPVILCSNPKIAISVTCGAAVGAVVPVPEIKNDSKGNAVRIS